MKIKISRDQFEDVLYSNTLSVTQKESCVSHMVHLTNLYVFENDKVVEVYTRVISSDGTDAKTEFFFENLRG